jgi:integrase
MRRGEILGLQWEHVNFLARTVFIAKSKTGRTRTIPMNNIVFKELMTLNQDAGPQDFVFSNSRTGVNTIPLRQAGGTLVKMPGS